MARRAVTQRRKGIVDQLAKMLVTHLQEGVFKGRSREDVAKRIGLSPSVINVPWFSDIPEICEAAGLDIGLAVRDDGGNEVVLWPLENFAEGFNPPRAAEKKKPQSSSPALNGQGDFKCSNRLGARRLNRGYGEGLYAPEVLSQLGQEEEE